MFPDSLGPGKYLPMFGGLHIKIVLLEIHGQLIAGIRLAQFLDQAKVSITEAGNVSQITVLDTCFKRDCALNMKQ